MFYFFDPLYFIILAPAILLGLWAQMKVKSTYAQAQQMPAPLSGAAAARHILDSSGADDVGIEVTHGFLSDHYDPRHKVLRLSPQVYQSRSLAAVGIAAHEAGHAIQHAHHYAPLAIRNAVVPAASIGSSLGFILIVIGAMMGGAAHAFQSIGAGQIILWAGLAMYGAVVFFQLVNLPVEFNASTRAKAELVHLGIIDTRQAAVVKKVLDAAALTYVAATLSAILTLLYILIRLGLLGGNRD
jgi:Zn-dependent membrane protease YugP